MKKKVREKVKKLLLIIQRDVHLSVQTCVMAEKTEVDTISGAVVRAAHKHGVEVPGHECIVRLVHAMEGRNKIKLKKLIIKERKMIFSSIKNGDSFEKVPGSDSDCIRVLKEPRFRSYGTWCI